MRSLKRFLHTKIEEEFLDEITLNKVYAFDDIEIAVIDYTIDGMGRIVESIKFNENIEWFEPVFGTTQIFKPHQKNIGDWYFTLLVKAHKRETPIIGLFPKKKHPWKD